MEEFKSNSFKSREEVRKEERPKQTKIIKGDGKLRKKSEARKFAEGIFASDMREIGSHIVNDVLIPELRDTIVDIVTNGIRTAMYGDTARGRSGNAQKVSYKSYYDYRNGANVPTRETRPLPSNYPINNHPAGYQYDGIVVDTKAEAEEILESLRDLINQYGVASVADMYDLAGITSSNPADNKYGWDNLSAATSARIREGYILRMPRTKPIN